MAIYVADLPNEKCWIFPSLCKRLPEGTVGIQHFRDSLADILSWNGSFLYHGVPPNRHLEVHPFMETPIYDMKWLRAATCATFDSNKLKSNRSNRDVTNPSKS